MKKKKPSIKSPAALERELYAAFSLRFKRACDVMAGEGFFSDISKAHLSGLFENRLPPVKLSFEKGDFSPGVEEVWQKYFSNWMQGTGITTVTGQKLSLSEYFREGILLLSYVDDMRRKYGEIPGFAKLSKTYGLQEMFFLTVEKVINFINSMCMVYSDLSGKILLTDFSATTMLRAEYPDNKIRLRFGRSISCPVKIDGQNRPVFRLGWSGLSGKMKYSSAFLTNGDSQMPLNGPLEVYVQQHALNRISERLKMHAGLIPLMLVRLFEREVSFCAGAYRSLIAFESEEKRLGYLVADVVGDKLIIRTFLFLTNDGTPEGKRLAELTRLKKMDKQYLDIDNIAGISQLALDEHPQLVELFEKAGCSHLFDLELIKVLDIDEFRKNPDRLLKYLAHSPFMSGIQKNT